MTQICNSKLDVKFLLIAFCGVVYSLAFSGNADAQRDPAIDKYFCEINTPLIQEQNLAIRNGDGVWADAYTENLGAYINCKSRTLNFSKKLHLEPKAGWQTTVQRRVSEHNCKDLMTKLAIDSGWAVSHTMTLLDGSQHKFDARCE